MILEAGHHWVTYVFRAETAPAEVELYSNHTHKDNSCSCVTQILMFPQVPGSLGRAPL